MPSNWFTNEAISNYIVFLAGIVVAVVSFLIRDRVKKKRPSIVLVEKEREASLLDIAPEARGFLQVTYGDHLVHEFYQTTFTISNAGETSLQEIEISFSFENASNAVMVALDRPIASANREVETITKLHAVTLRIPYLNPHKEYDDYEQLQLYSSEPIKGVNVMGSGAGWSVKYSDRVKYRAQLESLIAANSWTEIFVRAAIRGALSRW